MPKHTPTPWSIGGFILLNGHEYKILCNREAKGYPERCDIAYFNPEHPNYESNAAFIVRACNSHGMLIKTLKNIDGALSLLDEVKFGAMRLAIHHALKLAETGE